MMPSTTMHMIIAAKISTTECCFINAVERLMMTAQNTMKILNGADAVFSFSQADAMPME